MGPRTNYLFSYSSFTTPYSLTLYILLISHHRYYSKFIILTHVSHNSIFLSLLLPVAQHTSFTNWSNISPSSFLPQFHASYPLFLSDRKILSAHGSFIPIFAKGWDMRDLWLCMLLQYNKLQRKKRKIWENGWDAAQIKFSIRSFFASFSHFSSPMYYTHICSGLTNAHKAFVKTYDLNSAVFWMLISCCYSFQICIFMPCSSPLASFCPLHFTSSRSPSAPQHLTLGLKLTWASSTIFSQSLCLPLSALDCGA